MLASELDEMLANWPHDGVDDQYRIWLSLEDQVDEAEGRQVLYLPVGVGKTFIALRWLIQRVADAEPGGTHGDVGVYLVPNEWMERTANAALRTVADRAVGDRNAKALVDKAQAMIRIVRPSTSRSIGDDEWERVVALVADEFQNWNPDDSETTSSVARYSSIVHWVREHPDIAVLGVSATPCRYDQGQFLPEELIGTWLERDPLDFADGTDEARPRMSLAHARDRGFLCPWRFETLELDDESSEQIEQLLRVSDTDDQVRFGDYSKVRLRDIWEQLARDPRQLADDIVDAVLESEKRRIVVFLPPVAEGLDLFVRRLRDAVEDGGGTLFDFRSAAGGDAVSIFEDFRDTVHGGFHLLATIDRFVEGVSVNDIDCLVMLRATLSPRVAMQALGRGLRRDPDDEDKQCLILDGVRSKDRVGQWEALD